MGSLDDLLVDYSLPVEGLHDSSKVPFSFPGKPFAGGMSVAMLAQIAHTAIPLYYSIAHPELGGTRMVQYNIGKRILESSLYFIPGFLLGAAASHNRKVREGNTGRSRSLIERIYNSVFEHPEIAAVPAAVLFYLNFNSYKVLDLEPRNVIAGVAYSGDIFRSLVAGITAYCSATFSGSLLHADSLRVFANASLSRFFEIFSDFRRAASYQKKIAELPSIFAGKNHARLGDLYAKAGLALEAIDEYAIGLKPQNRGSIPSDIYGLPVTLIQAFFYEDKQKGSDSVMDLLRQATSDFRAGRLQRADAAFREAIMQDAEAILPHIFYSHFLYGIGRDEEGDREQQIANKIRFSSGLPFSGLVPGTRNSVYVETV